MGPILLVIGVVALFAAIVGGGIKFRDIEVGDVKSIWRQGLLGIFGIVVSLLGLVLVVAPDIFNSSDNDTAQVSANSDENGSSSDQNAASSDQGNAAAANEQNTETPAATDANATESSPDSNSDSTQTST